MVRPRKNGNRSDLLAPGDPTPLPVTAEPGQEYGEAGAQRDAQRATPMGGSPPSTGTVLPMSEMLSKIAPKPGTLPFLEPSEDQTTPVTADLARLPAMKPPAIADTLRSIAGSANGSDALNALAQGARLLGI